MSVVQNGTRNPANAAQAVGASTRTYDRSYSADQGLLPNVQGAFAFSSAGTVTLAGAFAAFAAETNVLIEGTALNNGLFFVTAATANALTLSPPPATEAAPATAVIRLA